MRLDEDDAVPDLRAFVSACFDSFEYGRTSFAGDSSCKPADRACCQHSTLDHLVCQRQLEPVSKICMSIAERSPMLVVTVLENALKQTMSDFVSLTLSCYRIDLP